MRSYLSARSFLSSYNSFVSGGKVIGSGVPHVSILRLLLSVTFFNDSSHSYFIFVLYDVKLFSSISAVGDFLNLQQFWQADWTVYPLDLNVSNSFTHFLPILHWTEPFNKIYWNHYLTIDFCSTPSFRSNANNRTAIRLDPLGFIQAHL